MLSMAHQTTHKVEERINELSDKSRELGQSTETEIQRGKIMGRQTITKSFWTTSTI